MISLIPVSQARPGFNANYQIQYTNIGTTSLSGAVDLSFDANKLTLLNTSITPNATTSTSLDWDYTNLMPLETRYIDIEFDVLPPPAVDIGDTLSYTATVTPVSGDYTPSNNIFVLDQVTIGSYDPNDITILEGPFISEVQAAGYLGILIRFQNTGTASAINVSIENTLDAFLDWSTFQPIASSHSYNTIISNDNEVNFVFNDIHLADSTTDESGSHGWVYYNIKPKSSFDIGDVISTKADIYFDYNLPIITNTATTEIDPTLSINDEVSNENVLLIYPNPVKDNLIISIQKNNAIYNLINIKGQVIKQGQLNLGDNIINLSNLSNGFYITKVTAEGQTYINKIYKK